jgi:hypothetical protein
VALVAAVAGALMGFAPAAFAEPPAPPAPIIPPPVQPANVGDLKFEATQYYESGAYLTDLQQAPPRRSSSSPAATSLSMRRPNATYRPSATPATRS